MVLNWIKQNRGLSAVMGASLVGLALACNEARNNLIEYNSNSQSSAQAKPSRKMPLEDMKLTTVIPKWGDTWTGLGAKYADETCLENTPYGRAVMQVNGLKTLKGLQEGRPYYILTTNDIPGMAYGSYKRAVALDKN